MSEVVSHEVLVERHSVLSGTVASLGATVKDHDEALLDFKLWRERIVGIMLVLVPAAGGVSAVIIHLIEKWWK